MAMKPLVMALGKAAAARALVLDISSRFLPSIGSWKHLKRAALEKWGEKSTILGGRNIHRKLKFIIDWVKEAAALVEELEI